MENVYNKIRQAGKTLAVAAGMMAATVACSPEQGKQMHAYEMENQSTVECMTIDPYPGNEALQDRVKSKSHVYRTDTDYSEDLTDATLKKMSDEAKQAAWQVLEALEDPEVRDDIMEQAVAARSNEYTSVYGVARSQDTTRFNIDLDDTELGGRMHCLDGDWKAVPYMPHFELGGLSYAFPETIRDGDGIRYHIHAVQDNSKKISNRGKAYARAFAGPSGTIDTTSADLAATKENKHEIVITDLGDGFNVDMYNVDDFRVASPRDGWVADLGVFRPSETDRHRPPLVPAVRSDAEQIADRFAPDAPKESGKYWKISWMDRQFQSVDIEGDSVVIYGEEIQRYAFDDIVKVNEDGKIVVDTE